MLKINLQQNLFSFRGLGCAFMVKIPCRMRPLVTSANFMVDTKNCEIKEKDSAQNNCKPLLTSYSIVLEMKPRSHSPGCRTVRQR